MLLEDVQYPRFHIGLKGSFFVGAENKTISVKHMDIIMLPQGEAHWVADQVGNTLTKSEQAADACELGSPLFQQGKITNKLICGQIQYDEGVLHPILDSLPSLLHFSDIKSTDPIWVTVMLIDTMMEKAHMVQSSIIDRLTEVLFLQLLNKYICDNKEVSGFFAALRNRRIHKVLGLIHKDPACQWSLDMLGEQVGMSRATLTRQFKNVLNIPPMTYVTNWRMMKAHHLLRHSSLSLEQIAELVGFSTARTLNKAFLRHYDYTPKELRSKYEHNT